ncbi:hypothetical protein LCGC14_2062350 [marine sediment metagenome]|uniref:Nucleotide modification associated domain-containing protein n=1 Tax=marine sediment metagenome TaxID=412755 RepID=A0A0F9EKP6_9ZZZZ
MIRQDLLDFIKEMEIILKEKEPKYKSTWKTIGLGLLRTKLKEHLKSITDCLLAGVDWDRERVKRDIIHIANYSFFLYKILKEE